MKYVLIPAILASAISAGAVSHRGNFEVNCEMQAQEGTHRIRVDTKATLNLDKAEIAGTCESRRMDTEELTSSANVEGPLIRTAIFQKLDDTQKREFVMYRSGITLYGYFEKTPTGYYATIDLGSCQCARELTSEEAQRIFQP